MTGNGEEEVSPASEIATEDVRARLVPVRGETAAGVWLEYGDVDHERYEPVPVAPTRYANIEQFAYRVSGVSMNAATRPIFDGDYVICVPYWMVRTTHETGDIVVVERRRGQLTERTCKELGVEQDRCLLWSRSTDPRFASPIVVDLNHDDQPGETIEIVGLVIGKYSPM